MFYTYSIKNLETGKVYIGSRTDKRIINIKPEEDLGVKYFSSTSDKELRRAIKDGKVSYKIIKEYSDAKECVKDENELIRLFWLFFGKENSYNHSYVNCNREKVWSTAGREESEEERLKKKNSHIGLHHSDETKKKISESNRNKHTGKFHSEEQKRKWSIERKGKGNPMFGKNPLDYMDENAKKQMLINKSENMKGEKNPMFGRKGIKSPIYGISKTDEHKKKISEANKGKPKPLFKYQTLSGEIKIMDKANAKRYHPDWILIGPVE